MPCDAGGRRLLGNSKIKLLVAGDDEPLVKAFRSSTKTSALVMFAGIMSLQLIALTVTADTSLANASAGYAIPQGRTAMTAASFRDTVGIVTHLSYGDTTYSDASGVARDLSDLGIRHVRDAVVLNNQVNDTAIRTVADAGVHFSLVLGAPTATSADFSQSYLNELTGPLAGTFDAVEEPNEYDCSGDAAWSTSLASYDQNLHDALRGVAGVRVPPIVGPSLCRGADQATVGSTTAVADTANLHPYAGGDRPEIALEAPIPASLASTGQSAVEATEDGYHTGGSGSQPSVSEAVQATTCRDCSSMQLPTVTAGHFSTNCWMRSPTPAMRARKSTLD